MRRCRRRLEETGINDINKAVRPPHRYNIYASIVMPPEPQPPNNDPSVELLHAIIDYSPIGTWITFKERIIYINRAGLTILGAKDESEVLGKSPFDVVHPDFHSRVRERMSAVLAILHPVPTEEEIFLRVDGTPVAVAVTAYAIPYAGGQALRVSFQSLTELEVHERERLESARRFRSILETVRALGLMLDAEGRITFVNNFFLELTGYGETEVLGRDWFGLFTPGNTPLRREFMEAVAGNRIFSHGENPIVTRSGESRLISWDNTILRGSDGIVQGTASIGRDITVQQAVMEELRQSEERFRALADGVAQLVWMADRQGHIYWYNRRWYEYTGTTPEQMKETGWHTLHHPDIAPVVAGRWNSSVTHGAEFAMTFPVRGRDGVYRPFLTRAVPSRDESGAILGWMGTHTDITEQKRSEDLLKRSNADLQQFAYVASHDLQEPLRTIISFTNILQRRLAGSLTRECEKDLGFITEAARRMSALIDALLSFCRISRDETRRYSNVDLNATVNGVLENLKAMVAETGAQITVTPLPSVFGDATQLGQVFQNLLSNSLRYRKPDECPLIGIRADRMENAWQFSVSDHGQGFPPEYNEAIFAVFRRLHGHEIPGTGIGLAICRAIVEQHGGRIWAEGRQNGGATVCFTLPAGAGVKDEPL